MVHKRLEEQEEQEEEGVEREPMNIGYCAPKSAHEFVVVIVANRSQSRFAQVLA